MFIIKVHTQFHIPTCTCFRSSELILNTTEHFRTASLSS